MTPGSFVPYPPEPSDWASSLRGRMFDQRVVCITGPLTDETAGRTAMELMTLDATGDSAIQLQIESPEGELGAALSIMDVLDTLGVNVTGLAMGLVGGPAVGILAVCHRRVSMPHARFHPHEPGAAFSGDARTIERWLEHRRDLWEQYCRRVAIALGRTVSEIEAVMAERAYLGATEALEMRLIQEIARPRGEVTAIGSLGAGPRGAGYRTKG
jgi:ATP-dependent Clp protease, protease subunit